MYHPLLSDMFNISLWYISDALLQWATLCCHTTENGISHATNMFLFSIFKKLIW
jgi:hypothetical protein